MKIRKMTHQEIAEYLVDLEDALERKLTPEEAEVCSLDYSFLHQFDHAGIEEVVVAVEGHISRLRAELQDADTDVEPEDFRSLRSVAGQAIRMLQLMVYRTQIILEAAKLEDASTLHIPGHGGLS